MAEVTATISFQKWVLTTQADIDECAEALYGAGCDNTVMRLHDDGEEQRYIDITRPTGLPRNVPAFLGNVVVLLGNSISILTAEQYADSPFYEEP